MFKTGAIALAALSTTANSQLITDEQIIEVNTNQIFDYFDFNGDGQLKKNQWKFAYRLVQYLSDGVRDNDNQSLIDVLEDIDENEDDQVCQNEFRTWICTELDFDCEDA